MAIKQLYTAVDLKETWKKVTITPNDSFYIIAIKGEEKGKVDTIDPTEIKKVIFDLGIESGIEGEPLYIGNIVLNFEDYTSDKPNINDKTALVRLTKYPPEFFIKPRQIQTKKGVLIKEGKAPIEININEFKSQV